MDRRRFLEIAGAAVAVGGTAAAGCSKGSGSGPGSSTTTARATPSTTTAASASDWAQLRAALEGRLVQPGDADYDAQRELFNPRFDDIRPAGVASCRSPQDVQACLAFARRTGVPVSLRSGGHSYGGWSTGPGLVVDTSPMAAVQVGSGGTATIGAGARLGRVYGALAGSGLAIPAGSCPSVGMAGLAMGGGVGVLGRALGLTCDQLLAVDLVTAAGELVTCSPDHEPDLFWAHQGGGGGNFGVVTGFTVRTHAAHPVVVWSLGWPWEAAAAVLQGWQGWGPDAPDDLFSDCQLLSTDPGSPGPTVRVNGLWRGDLSGLAPLLDDLRGRVGAPPSSSTSRTLDHLSAMLWEAGCYGKTVDACLQVQREASSAASDVFATPLGHDAAAVCVQYVSERQADHRLFHGGVAFDAWGGAIGRVAPAATAFVHRTARCAAQYSGTWPVGTSAADIAAHADWLARFHAAMRPFASGRAYVNYADPTLTDWATAYYGENLARLRTVKAAWDPDGLFRFPQGITA
jgi:FAD/FMN-containing dehydrogenase